MAKQTWICNFHFYMFFFLMKVISQLIFHLKGSRDAFVLPTVHQGGVGNLYDQISCPAYISSTHQWITNVLCIGIIHMYNNENMRWSHNKLCPKNPIAHNLLRSTTSEVLRCFVAAPQQPPLLCCLQTDTLCTRMLPGSWSDCSVV